MAFPQKNYTYGRYRIYFAKFDEGTKVSSDGQRYFGNTPSLNMTSESEALDHFDSDNGVRIKDDSMLLELNRTGGFTTDHISPENLALFFLGNASVMSQAASTAQDYSIASVRSGRRYQIGQSPSAPAGVRGLTNVVVTSDPVGTTYVAGTDYVVNLDTGGLSIIEGGGIVDGSPIIVTYDAVEADYNRIVTADNAEIYGSLFFESTNPKGEKMDYLIPYAVIRPDGDFELKSDEWQTLPFSFEVLKLDDNTPSVIINGRPGSGV